jgi:hypothetical protein
MNEREGGHGYRLSHMATLPTSHFHRTAWSSAEWMWYARKSRVLSTRRAEYTLATTHHPSSLHRNPVKMTEENGVVVKRHTRFNLLQLRKPRNEAQVHIQCFQTRSGVCADGWVVRVDGWTVRAYAPEVDYRVVCSYN